MTYKTVQTGVATVIKKVAGYDANNVKEDDYRVVSHGKIKAVILRRGATEREFLGMGGSAPMLNRFTINCELYIPFRTQTTTLADDVIVEAQKIVDEFDKWPKLDNTANVINAECEAVGEPEEWLIGGRWWRQLLEVRVDEVTTVTRSE